MGMSRCYSLIKCLLILFNIVFLLVGVCACGACAWALWDGRASETSAGRAGLSALLAWAAALTVGATATLCGAARSSGTFLACGASLLALAAAAEAAAACWGGAHLPQLRASLTDALRGAVQRDYGVVDSRTQMFDVIQQQLECCGAESVRDWQVSSWSRSAVSAENSSPAPLDMAALGSSPLDPASSGPASLPHQQRALDLSVAAPAEHYWVPASCCSTSDESECESSRRVSWTTNTLPSLHASPCAPRVLETLSNGAKIPLIVAAGLLITHALTVLLALALCLKAQPETRYKA